jgi:hypothetical protein
MSKAGVVVVFELDRRLGCDIGEISQATLMFAEQIRSRRRLGVREEPQFRATNRE